MSRMVWRTMRSTAARLRSAWVVISPATTARAVVTRVSQAARLSGSASRQWSSTASLIWSATLSGWPMETDSLVNRYRSAVTATILGGREGGPSARAGHAGGLYERGRLWSNGEVVTNRFAG